MIRWPGYPPQGFTSTRSRNGKPAGSDILLDRIGCVPVDDMQQEQFLRVYSFVCTELSIPVIRMVKQSIWVDACMQDCPGVCLNRSIDGSHRHFPCSLTHAASSFFTRGLALPVRGLVGHPVCRSHGGVFPANRVPSGHADTRACGVVADRGNGGCRAFFGDLLHGPDPFMVLPCLFF